MFAHHDLTSRWPHRWVNELYRIADGRLPGVFASAKRFIALTDFDVSWSEHGGAIAQEEVCLARHVLQALRVLYHLPVYGVRQGPHESGIKVGDEQRRVLALKRQSSHNVPPVSVSKTQASISRRAPLLLAPNIRPATQAQYAAPVTALQ